MKVITLLFMGFRKMIEKHENRIKSKLKYSEASKSTLVRISDRPKSFGTNSVGMTKMS